MSHEVQKPIFAAASANHQGDDIDFNEIFSEYFTNEFENPIDAYTGTMGNSSGGVVSMHQVVAGTPSAQHSLAVAGTESLPTGGIRTAFHSAAVAPGSQGFQYQAAKKAKVEHPVIAYPQAGGLTSRLGVPMPLLQGQNGSQGVATQLVANPATAGVSLP
ncbi:MAG: hypothetical protein SGBAC_013171, partial [Bacillariaceae sp.]